MTDLETKNIKDHPIPEDAVWKEESDRLFYEQSLVDNEETHYHIRDGFYYLGQYVEEDVVGE